MVELALYVIPPTFNSMSINGRLRILVLVAITLGCGLFSSCFQIVEDITVKDDGSGRVVLMANFSESRTKLASVMLLDSVQGYKVPSKQDVQQELADIVAQLRKVEGISQVSYKVDFDRFTAQLTFSFADVSKLNGVTDMVFSKFKIEAKNTSSFSFTKSGKFSRQYQYDPEASKAFDKLKAEDRRVFEGAKYTSIYRFDREVGHVSNTQAKTSTSGTSVMLQAPIVDLITGRINVSNYIQLK